MEYPAVPYTRFLAALATAEYGIIDDPSADRGSPSTIFPHLSAPVEQAVEALHS
jgi:hypothetical protein